MPQSCTLDTPNIITSSFLLLFLLLHTEICRKRHGSRKNTPVNSLSCFLGTMFASGFLLSQALIQIANFTRCSGSQVFLGADKRCMLVPQLKDWRSRSLFFQSLLANTSDMLERSQDSTRSAMPMKDIWEGLCFVPETFLILILRGKICRGLCFIKTSHGSRWML